MNEQFESMMEGLTELLEYARGDETRCRSRFVRVPDSAAPSVELESALDMGQSA